VAAEETFPADWIVSCTERSLRNLGLETIDIQQFHVWSDEWVGQGDWLDGVEQLKREGKIRFFGVSINDHQPENAIRLVDSGVVDTVQVIYNLFDQSPEEALFPTVEAARVGVIVRVPFDEGALTGSVRPDTTFPEGDFRNRYFAGERRREVWDRVQAIARDLDVEVDEVAEIALRFCLSHPATSVVIPGMRSTRNVERNVRAASAGPLEESQLTTLRRHRWVVDFY
jgi:aryl-alcohol dehydrogenase-like predicted oxidoreductase